MVVRLQIPTQKITNNERVPQQLDPNKIQPSRALFLFRHSQHANHSPDDPIVVLPGHNHSALPNLDPFILQPQYFLRPPGLDPADHQQIHAYNHIPHRHFILADFFDGNADFETKILINPKDPLPSAQMAKLPYLNATLHNTHPKTIFHPKSTISPGRNP
jgi:hypothetical protein